MTRPGRLVFPIQRVSVTLALIAVFQSFCGSTLVVANLCLSEQCACDPSVTSISCVCNGLLQEITLGNVTLPATLHNLEIKNCDIVKVDTFVFRSAPKLTRVELTGIRNLHLMENSLAFREGWDDRKADDKQTVDLIISDSFIPEMPSYLTRGKFGLLEFKNVTIQNVRTYSISNVKQIDTLRFERCHFREVEPHAFKRFSVGKLIFRDVKFESGIPHAAFWDVAVLQEFGMRGLTAPVVEREAFNFHGPKIFHLQASVIGNIQENAFHGRTRGPIIVDDNVFGKVERNAFLQLYTEMFYKHLNGRQEFIFSNNSVANLEPAGLAFNVSDYDLKMGEVMVNKQCACEDINFWKFNVVKYATTSLTFPMGGVSYANPTINYNDSILCRDSSSSSAAYVPINVFYEKSCASRMINWGEFITFLAAVFVAVPFLLCLGIVYYCCQRHGCLCGKRKRHRRRYRRSAMQEDFAFEDVSPEMVPVLDSVAALEGRQKCARNCGAGGSGAGCSGAGGSGRDRPRRATDVRVTMKKNGRSSVEYVTESIPMHKHKNLMITSDL